jgi:uncharacterized protein YbaP (TraB family)
MLGFAALATSAATSPAQTATARPALWQVSDRDTTIYLFGTIHLLPKDYPWRTPRFDKALSRSQTLVVETIVDNKNPAALAAELARLGFRPGLPLITDRVSPAKRPLLETAIRSSLARAMQGLHEQRLSAASAGPDGDLGRGVHAARHSVQGSRTDRRGRRRSGASQRLHPGGQVGRPAGNQ